MSRAQRLSLLVLGLVVSGLATLAVRSPGYMDADYYFATAREWVQGHGLREPFLWNYLDDPQVLPHPSHSYWMPLPTLLAATGMVFFGPTFPAARIPFVLVAALLPWLTAETALRMTGNPRLSWASGLLALAPGFFAAYLVTTDSFALYALIGGGAILLMSSTRAGWVHWLAAGACAGLAHLTRADGVLWVPLGLLALSTVGKERLRRAFAFLLGYGVLLAPWWARNLAAFGQIFPPGLTRTLWLTGYNDLFLYPASVLTPARWVDSGWTDILTARLSALASNLTSIWAVNGLIFLLPLMVAGAWRHRTQREVKLTAGYLLLLLAVMSFVFPFAGERGGIFHSSIAAMPVLWGLVPPGLSSFLEWGARARGWNVRAGWAILGSAAGILALGFTAFQYWQRAIGPDAHRLRWSQSDRTYERLASTLGPGQERVAVNNPPGFYLASGRTSVVIPSGGEEVLGNVLRAFDVGWVILDQNRPPELAERFDHPSSTEDLVWVSSIEDPEGGVFVIYRVEKSP